MLRPKRVQHDRLVVPLMDRRRGRRLYQKGRRGMLRPKRTQHDNKNVTLSETKGLPIVNLMRNEIYSSFPRIIFATSCLCRV